MKKFLPSVLITSIIAGTLDYIAAYARQYLVSPSIADYIFRYIAGAALGLENSMEGGTGIIITGIIFHYFIAFCFTLFFFLVYKRFMLHRFNKYITGLVYGLCVWVVMNIVVLPLTRLPHYPFNFMRSIVSAWILMSMFGLPVSIGADYYFRKVRR